MNRFTRLASNPFGFYAPAVRTKLCKPLLNKPPQYSYSRPMYSNNRYSGTGIRLGKSNQLMLIGAGGVLFGAYYFTHLEQVPISGRSRMIGVSPETEKNMGETEWEKIKQQFSSQILPASDKRVQLVKHLALPIIKESGLENLEWEFIVVNEDMANAFVLPGGKVCVFTGIMKLASDPEELATVLSHEIGHVVARHNAEKWTFAQVAYFGGTALKILIGDYVPEQITNLLIHYAMALPFSRRCENEADHIGLILMSKACYDPQKAIDLWTKFQETDKNAGGNSEFLKYTSTHPSHGDRIQHVKELLPQAYEARKASHCERFHERVKKSFL